MARKPDRAPAETQNQTPRAARALAAWQIVGYIDGDTGERAYAVVHRGRRRAWGLRTREAAERWLIREKVPVQQQLPLIGRV